MKKIILLTIISFFTTNGFGQTMPSNEFTKEYYLQKSKNQETAAWILLSAGGALTVAGFISMDNTSKNDSFGFPDDSSYYLTLGGFAIGLGSIPLFISSAKNARKAASLSINYQPILLPRQNNMVQNYTPSLSFKITF